MRIARSLYFSYIVSSQNIIFFFVIIFLFTACLQHYVWNVVKMKFAKKNITRGRFLLYDIHWFSSRSIHATANNTDTHFQYIICETMQYHLFNILQWNDINHRCVEFVLGPSLLNIHIPYFTCIDADGWSISRIEKKSRLLVKQIF